MKKYDNMTNIMEKNKLIEMEKYYNKLIEINIPGQIQRYQPGQIQVYQPSNIQVYRPQNLERIIYEGEVDPERFINRRILANGGHSKIYTALDKKTGRTVALKRHLHYIPLSRDASAKEIREAEKRFRSEAQALSKLGQNHPGIVQAYGYFITEEDGERVPYLVMEYLEGDSLGKQIADGKAFSEYDARLFILSCGAILDYMHNGTERQIIYRDLKPQNVFPMPTDAEWPYKLVDFSETKVGNATFMSGSVLGTPGYNAPEVWGGGEANTTSDFYSLARIALAMVLQDEEKFNENWRGFLSLYELRQAGYLNVSDEFFRVIEKATVRKPEERYQNYVEMVRALGYNIDRPPRTRQELETILQHKSLPPEIRTKKKKKQTGLVYQARRNLENLVHKSRRNLENLVHQSKRKLEEIVSGKAVRRIGRGLGELAGDSVCYLLIGAIPAGIFGRISSLKAVQVSEMGGGLIETFGAGLLTGSMFTVPLAVVFAGEAANMNGLSEDQKFHAVMGGIYGFMGVGLMCAAVHFLDYSTLKEVILGTGIQIASTLIEPLRISFRKVRRDYW
jgi:serine/threonine protein kinase